MRKIFSKVILGMWMAAGVFLTGSVDCHAEEPVIVVLDPGHGGENLGAEYQGLTEKDMTMVVAQAMRDELELYEGIEVYLTHESDADMTLEERVEYAESLNADFFFCLHFNMSKNHNLFGAEVWVSAFGEQYEKGYTFAKVEMDMLEELGLYSRGIKTKLNEEGEDYYGILRHATIRGIPAALIEHCHLDQKNDEGYYETEELLKEFGVLDATAVAKYYGLKSEVLGVDYSNYQNVEIPVPTAPIKPDETEPDISIIEVTDVNPENGDVEVLVSAEDYDSYILYYSYSYDGGANFSELQRWEPKDADNLSFTMNVPSGTIPEIVVNVYNGFDGFTESNHVSLPSISYMKKGDAVEAGAMTAENSRIAEEGAGGTVSSSLTDGAGGGADVTGGADGGNWANAKNRQNGKEKETREITVLYFLQVVLICASLLFALFLPARILFRKNRKKKRRKK